MLFNKNNNIFGSLYFHKNEPFYFDLIRDVLYSVIGTLILLFLYSCKKIVEIKQPVDSITTEGAFSNDATANQTVAGIYSKMINTDYAFQFGSGGTTLCTGLSSDELSAIGLPNPGDPLSQLYTNELLTTNDYINQLWNSAYFSVYQATSSIEGLENSDAISSSLKNKLIGECKFLRAFSLFYLTNMFGDIPLPLTSDWHKTYLIKRTPKTEIYQQIINDLKDAQGLLPEDYSSSNKERIRANKYAATALLARVYLYQKDWQNAEDQATAVISNSSTYSLVKDLNKVFLKNSSEAILQFQPNPDFLPYGMVEQSVITVYSFYLSDSVLNAFDNLDERKSSWIEQDSITFPGITLNYPAKYEITFGNQSSLSQYYMVLRLGEQYLIRAEARAQLNKINEAQNDLNVIRQRANVTLSTANTQQELLSEIEHERRVELFSEWGHRWFDLIRTGKANKVLGALKGSSWQSTDQLYPIPQSEILNNPNLDQNIGY